MAGNERRRERQDNLRPEADNQAAAAATSPEDVIELGPPDATAGDSRDTGAGTGGATVSDGRARHNEGAHLGHQPNS